MALWIGGQLCLNAGLCCLSHLFVLECAKTYQEWLHELPGDAAIYPQSEHSIPPINATFGTSLYLDIDDGVLLLPLMGAGRCIAVPCSCGCQHISCNYCTLSMRLRMIGQIVFAVAIHCFKRYYLLPGWIVWLVLHADSSRKCLSCTAFRGGKDTRGCECW